MLRPWFGIVIVAAFAFLPEDICAGVPTFIIGAVTIVIAGATIGSRVAGSNSGVLPGIFGALFWGVCAPFLLALPVGILVLPLLTLIFGRNVLDSVFSIITVYRINLVFAAIGIVVGSIVGGRIARPRDARAIQKQCEAQIAGKKKRNERNEPT